MIKVFKLEKIVNKVQKSSVPKGLGLYVLGGGFGGIGQRKPQQYAYQRDREYQAYLFRTMSSAISNIFTYKIFQNVHSHLRWDTRYV